MNHEITMNLHDYLKTVNPRRPRPNRYRRHPGEHPALVVATCVSIFIMGTLFGMTLHQIRNLLSL
jgi:hypothetical protein